MKGIILAGGLGTRLLPFTRVINKHLMNIAGKPMVQYPIETLKKAGIGSILIITNPHHVEQFKQIIDEEKLGVKITYKTQEKAAGIADALRQARDFAMGEKMVVILGDNIIIEDISEHVTDFEKSNKSKILLKEVPDPHRFGIATMNNGTIEGIDEKPEEPKSNLAVIGAYMYCPDVFDIIEGLKPSERGEYEITSVNQAYLDEKRLTASMLKGPWIDAGTIESLHEAATLVKEHMGENQG
ncbi:sugar nucleotidyltransferase [Candidatus Woesearchaeota archaeon]|nr:sugar nucleotidyltransferase [Candidatus Woesearchaeota archaeon]